MSRLDFTVIFEQIRKIYLMRPNDPIPLFYLSIVYPIPRECSLSYIGRQNFVLLNTWRMYLKESFLNRLQLISAGADWLSVGWSWLSICFSLILLKYIHLPNVTWLCFFMLHIFLTILCIIYFFIFYDLLLFFIIFYYFLCFIFLCFIFLCFIYF